MSATTDLLAKCHEQMGVTQLEETAADYREASARHDASVRPELSLVSEIAAAASTGEGPDGAVARIDGWRTANDGAVVTVRVLAGAADQLDELARTTRAAAVGTGLALVREELDAVLVEARPLVASLGPVTTPAAAVEADRGEDWRTLTALAARLSECRQAQRALVADTRRDGTGPVLATDLFGYVRDADRYIDVRAYREQQLGPRRANTLTGEPEERIVPPWLVPGVDALLFTCRDDVEPWVPSMAQLRSEQAAVEARARSIDEVDDRSSSEQWRDRGEPSLHVRPATAWAAAFH